MNFSNKNDNFNFSCVNFEYNSFLKELKCNLDNSKQTDDNLNTIYKNNIYGYYNLSIPVLIYN